MESVPEIKPLLDSQGKNAAVDIIELLLLLLQLLLLKKTPITVTEHRCIHTSIKSNVEYTGLILLSSRRGKQCLHLFCNCHAYLFKLPQGIVNTYI